MPDGTNAVVLAAHTFIARLAAIIPPPKRHVTRYFGVLSSHSKSKYIPWNELLRRTFNVELKCPNCKGDLRLIALIKTQATIKKILVAMGLPTLPPAAAPARAPPCTNFHDWQK